MAFPESIGPIAHINEWSEGRGRSIRKHFRIEVPLGFAHEEISVAMHRIGTERWRKYMARAIEKPSRLGSLILVPLMPAASAAFAGFAKSQGRKASRANAKAQNLTSQVTFSIRQGKILKPGILGSEREEAKILSILREHSQLGTIYVRTWQHKLIIASKPQNRRLQALMSKRDFTTTA